MPLEISSIDQKNSFFVFHADNDSSLKQKSWAQKAKENEREIESD